MFDFKKKWLGDHQIINAKIYRWFLNQQGMVPHGDVSLRQWLRRWSTWKVGSKGRCKMCCFLSICMYIYICLHYMESLFTLIYIIHCKLYSLCICYILYIYISFQNINAILLVQYSFSLASLFSTPVALNLIFFGWSWTVSTKIRSLFTWNMVWKIFYFHPENWGRFPF